MIGLLFPAIAAKAQNWLSLNETGKTETEIKLIYSNSREIAAGFYTNAYKLTEVSVLTGIELIPLIPDGVPLLIKGAPDLRRLSRSIIIPGKAEMQVEVISSDFVEINNIDVAPSKGSFNMSIQPGSIPYNHNKTYEQDSFFPGKLADLGNAFILKDFRGQTIYVYPLQYNPVSKILRIYRNITVRITSRKETGGINQISRDRQPQAIDRDFDHTYKRLFLNYDASRYTPSEERGRMLIISRADCIPAMQRFVAWKKLKGIPAEIIAIEDVGDTISSISDYIRNYYISSNRTLKFVLFVGDYAQIKSPIKTEYNYPNSGPSDISYGYMEGSDHYAEVFVGRFSCESPADAETQVERTIHYERDLTTADTWLNRGLMIGGNDPEMINYNGDLIWEHLRYRIRPALVTTTYVDVPEFYDGSHGGFDSDGNPTHIMVSGRINSGIGNLIHAGHTDWWIFQTSEFSVNDIPGLTNFGKLPQFWVIGCSPGRFHDKPCLAEWLMRSQNAGSPTGALTAYMGSCEQLMNPPCAGQIEFTHILTGQVPSNTKITAGGLVYNSCMKMIEQFPDTTGGEFTADTWILFGDPSIVINTDNPAAMTVNHPESVSSADTGFVVACSVEGALISLTAGGEIVATDYSNGSPAKITVNPELFAENDTLKVTVTAQNRVTYQGYALILPFTDIGELSENDIVLFPNPNSGSFDITLKKEFQNLTVCITNALGQKVLVRKVTGQNPVHIDASGLIKGIYVVEIITDKSTYKQTMTLTK